MGLSSVRQFAHLSVVSLYSRLHLFIRGPFVHLPIKPSARPRALLPCAHQPALSVSSVS
ncbi:hypothetical protein Scep_021757 [Stephania cephalantha]|uniref:Uncharacterized protein n=1 Tax=Stephania cephalantha TaxID=152367 RepID=A0AAP0F948_9MAGN